MQKRISMAAVLAALFIASIASASDEAVDCGSEAAAVKAAPLPPHSKTLADLFVPEQGTEVLIARVGADGKLVFACVDSAEAAKRFFEAPVEKLPARATQK